METIVIGLLLFLGAGLGFSTGMLVRSCMDLAKCENEFREKYK